MFSQKVNVKKRGPIIIIHKELKLKLFINYATVVKTMNLIIWNSHLKLRF